MRWPSLHEDFWELESAEARLEAHPEFEIPDRSVRANLRIGQLAKLLFRLEGEEEDGTAAVQVERMWVRVSEVLDESYIGILDNQPASYEPETETYLVLGTEIPFAPEHVIDVGLNPGLVGGLRRQPQPTRRWPRV